MTAILSNIVEMCVFRFRDVRPEYLVLKRSPDEVLYPGIWQMVTGTVNVGETAVEAALRELNEETGLSPERLWTVPYVNLFYDRAADAMNLCPLFAAQVDRTGEPRLSSEHTESVWRPFEEARRLLVWPGQRRGIEIVEQFIAGGEEVMRLSLVP